MPVLSSKTYQADDALMIAICDDDRDALRELINIWQKPLLAYAYRFLGNEADAREVVEEVFVRVYHSRHKYRMGGGFRAWIFTITANLCRNKHRWRQRHPVHSMEAWAEDTQGEHSGGGLRREFDSKEADPSQNMDKAELKEQVAKAINRLPDSLRETFILHFYESLSYEEISKIVGCRRKGVETRLYRARKYLKEILRPYVASMP